MAHVIYNSRQKHSGIDVPANLAIKTSAYDLPNDIKRFFGKTGVWWGTWKSPQLV